MPNTEKKITVLEFIVKASMSPLGPRLYKAALLPDEKGIEKVKELMMKEGVSPGQVKKHARRVFETARDYIKNAKIPEPPGGGIKY